MSWDKITPEEKSLGLDPSKYTKKPWSPQDAIGYHKKIGPISKTSEEQFKEESGWGLVEENDERRMIEEMKRQQSLLGLGAALTDSERVAIKAQMMKRLGGL